MMLGVYVVVWLSVLSMAIAGDTTPANTLPPSSRKTLLQEVKGIKQMLASKQQAAPCSNPVGASWSSKELWAIKSKLTALETKLEATQINLKATKAKQDATEQVLKSTRATLKTLKANRKGSTFIHWGRKTCSNASHLVYSGVGGGSWYNHPGAASNRLCLTMKPQFDGTRVPVKYAYLYGAEYEEIPNHHDHNVPCSVCRVAHSTTIMIPATHVCPKGWTTQYTGHLTAGYYNHKSASQYNCLDKDPENANSGNQNQDASEFFYTITHCGNLPCPPYANRQVVLCVVCSK